MALFSIDGNHVGYEDELDLPNRINFDGAALSLGPIKVSLAPLDGALASLITLVNKTIVPGIEFLQYRSYNALTQFFLVRETVAWGSPALPAGTCSAQCAMVWHMDVAYPCGRQIPCLDDCWA